MAKKRKKTKKKAGRKKRTFTQEDIDYIADCAFHGCQTKTIETLTGIPETTLRRRFGDLLAKKRAERKLELRKGQDKEASKGNSALLIFLGKNELGQMDRKDITSGGEKIIPVAVCPVLSSKICKDKGVNAKDLQPRVD